MAIQIIDDITGGEIAKGDRNVVEIKVTSGPLAGTAFKLDLASETLIGIQAGSAVETEDYLTTLAKAREILATKAQRDRRAYINSTLLDFLEGTKGEPLLVARGYRECNIPTLRKQAEELGLELVTKLVGKIASDKSVARLFDVWVGVASR